MIAECARCGHEINTDTAEGAEQGITRAWDGEQVGYRDYHKLCRDLTVKERREQRRPGQVQQTESQRRRPGPKPQAQAQAQAQAAEPIVDDLD